MMIIKKAQGLMNDAEMQALLDNYNIYLVQKDYTGVDYDKDESIQIGLGGMGFDDLTTYTISPQDYNLLMTIGSYFKTKGSLYVIVSFENEFSIEDFTIDVKYPPPTKILERHNITTKLNKFQPRGYHRKELLAKNTFEHINPESVEKRLDEVLTLIIPMLKEKGIPIEPLTVEDYMSNTDRTDTIFTINYNVDKLRDKYTKERNIVFPVNFTDGFEKYFNEDGIKRVLKKIRKIINKMGGRERTSDVNKIKSRFYFGDSVGENLEDYVDATVGDIVYQASKFLTIPDIKELDPMVFENMKNYILTGMKTYYEIKGFSKPLTENRLAARAISREVTSLIRTAVTSSLPGFQTSQGEQRGYTFNKSLRVNVDTPLGLFEAVYRKNPEAMKIFKFNFNGFLMDQPLTETIKNRILYAIENGPIKLSSDSARFRVTNDYVGFIISDARINKEVYAFSTRVFREFISNLGNQQITINEAILQSGALFCLEKSLGNLAAMIAESNTEFKEFRRSVDFYLRPDAQRFENKISAPVRFEFPRGNRGENFAIADFIFSSKPAAIANYTTFTNLRLESVEVSIYRRRNLNRTFEIDINAEYGFDLEIRRVINRILNPQDFYDANTNPRERSSRWIISIVREQANKPNVIVVEEPKYDSLTGSTRGMWLIFSEGKGAIYFTIDDSKQGQGSTQREREIKGSLCVGTATIFAHNPSYDGVDEEGGHILEYKDNKYSFSASESSCVNLKFPREATKEDVERGVGKYIGEMLSLPRKNKLEGGNLDPMGSATLLTFNTGNLLGQDPNIAIAQTAGDVYIPVFSTSRKRIDKGKLIFDFENNRVLHKTIAAALKVSDLKLLYRFLYSRFRQDEIKSALGDNLSRDNPSLLGNILDMLKIDYEISSDFDVRQLFGNEFYEILTSRGVQVTTVEEIKPVIEANKDKVKEAILQVRLGADYGGGFEDEDYSYIEELERRKQRRRGQL